MVLSGVGFVLDSELLDTVAVHLELAVRVLVIGEVFDTRYV